MTLLLVEVLERKQAWEASGKGWNNSKYGGAGVLLSFFPLCWRRRGPYRQSFPQL